MRNLYHFLDLKIKLKKNFNKNFKIKNEKFLIKLLKIKYNEITKIKQKKNKLNLIGCNWFNSFILIPQKDENKLFIFGCNMYFQLGLNIEYSISIPNVSKSLMHMFMSDEVRNTNVNSITNNIIESYKSKLFSNFSKIKKFEMGDKHNLILFENNDLFSFGDNKHGQCGYYDDNEYEPQKIKFFEDINKFGKIKDIICGCEFSFVLLENNDLYAFGINDNGQCGVEASCYNIPQKINLKVKKVFTSHMSNHSFILTKKKNIYGFGTNTFKQLGIFDSVNEFEPIPLKIKSLKGAKDIYCGYGNTIVLKKNNNLFGFGYNFYGQIFNKNEGTIIKEIKEINFFKNLSEYKKIKKISLNLSSIIYLIKTKTGELKIYGMGNLIVNKYKEIKEFNFFKNKEIIDICSGLEHFLAISKNNEVYSWGKNSYGQLGNGDFEDQLIPIKILKF